MSEKEHHGLHEDSNGFGGLSHGRIVYFGCAPADTPAAELAATLARHGFPAQPESLEAPPRFQELLLTGLAAPHLELELKEHRLEFSATGRLVVDGELLDAGKFELKIPGWRRLEFNPSLKGTDALLNRLLGAVGLRQQDPDMPRRDKSGFGVPEYLKLIRLSDDKLHLRTRVEVVDVETVFHGCQWHAIFKVNQPDRGEQ